MTHDLEKYGTFYKGIQRIERQLHKAIDLGIDLKIDSKLLDKMETARQAILEKVDELFGEPPRPPACAGNKDIDTEGF